jgi:hypothetical protein
MPHKIEPAPSGRAACRGCKQTIAKGELRFGEAFVNAYTEEGTESYRYWHLRCAATKLANDLAPVLAAYSGDVPERAEIDALVAEHLQPPMPHTERAPNGRAKCRACEENIGKGELRIAFERVFEGPMGPQKGAAYVHARCLRRYLEREVEQGREAPRAEELMRQLETHGAPSPEDVAAVRAALAPAGDATSALPNSQPSSQPDSHPNSHPNSET